MTITLYNNTSENRVISKSITQLASYSGTLRDQSSIIEPTFIIEGSINLNANYFYIPEFGRYYYIKDIVSVRNNAWAISGEVDVLMSFKNDILNSVCIARRNSDHIDNYLEDPYYKTYQNPNVNFYEFPQEFSTTNDTLVLVCG